MTTTDIEEAADYYFDKYFKDTHLVKFESLIKYCFVSGIFVALVSAQQNDFPHLKLIRESQLFLEKWKNETDNNNN